MRRLVSFRQIVSINPIPNADAIEAVRIDGWTCVSKKGEFKVGDWCLYFEIDSILPSSNTLFNFLTEKSSKEWNTETGTLLGHRLRTVKLRGQVSQGLALPIPDWIFRGENTRDGNPVWILDADQYLHMGDDLAWVFGVEKYEMPIYPSLAGVQAGAYPSWLPKTDQERVQNLSFVPPGTYVVEEKVEGSSMTVYWDEEKAGVTSRNIDLKTDQEGNSFVDLAKQSGLLQAVADIGQEVQKKFAIRGELVGPGIQGNIYGLKEFRLYVFDVYADGYIPPDARNVFLSRVLGRLNSGHTVYKVPVLDSIRIMELDPEAMLKMADGPSVINKEVSREGLVFKALNEDDFGYVFSFKAVSNAYLLKEKG